MNADAWAERCCSTDDIPAFIAADLAARAPADAAGAEGRRLRVLVKGSRGSAMDRIVNALLAQGDATHAA